MNEENLPVHILAKAYANEFLKHIDTVIASVCPGCTLEMSDPGQFYGQRYHVACKANISDQLLLCADILPDVIDEHRVSDTVLHLLAEFGWSAAHLSRQLFDIEKRRQRLCNPCFWNLIVQYSERWAQLPERHSHEHTHSGRIVLGDTMQTPEKDF